MGHDAPAALEALMDAAWPAADRADTAGWVLRAAAGVTQRANSVWPREPGADPHAQQAALREARLWYRTRRQPLIFQVFDGAESGPLNTLLDTEGFTRQSETLVMARHGAGTGTGVAAGDRGAVELSNEPSGEWLRLWWSVDGRGDDAALEVARGILTGCPALYALVRDDDGVPAAVGRLALPVLAPGRSVDTPAADSSQWGGVYCMATRPDARCRGFGARVLQALLDDGSRIGLAGYWLLVTAANTGARQLYGRAGFTESGRYLYRQERPKRHLTGC